VIIADAQMRKLPDQARFKTRQTEKAEALKVSDACRRHARYPVHPNGDPAVRLDCSSENLTEFFDKGNTVVSISSCSPGKSLPGSVPDFICCDALGSRYHCLSWVMNGQKPGRRHVRSASNNGLALDVAARPFRAKTGRERVQQTNARRIFKDSPLVKG
jgi:hypothetical protein